MSWFRTRSRWWENLILLEDGLSSTVRDVPAAEAARGVLGAEGDCAALSSGASSIASLSVAIAASGWSSASSARDSSCFPNAALQESRSVLAAASICW